MIQRLSLDFLKENGIDDVFYEWVRTTFELDFQYSPYMDWNYARTVLLEYIEANPEETTGWLQWFDNLKNSKEYVYYNGEQITMLEKYQVFNPLTGLHTQYENESEMQQALTSLAQEVLNTFSPTVVREIGNENGDVAWIATDFHKKLNITYKE
jgi:hypothetical protein